MQIFCSDLYPKIRIRNDKHIKKTMLRFLETRSTDLSDIRLEASHTVASQDEPEFKGSETAPKTEMPVSVVDYSSLQGRGRVLVSNPEVKCGSSAYLRRHV